MTRMRDPIPKQNNMKTETVVNSLGLKVITQGSADEFAGVYAGDFLSRAMSRVTEGDLWITIMNNVNVIAVASLTDAAAVILAEGVEMAPDVTKAALEKDVTVLSSDKTVYELCAALDRLIADMK